MKSFVQPRRAIGSLILFALLVIISSAAYAGSYTSTFVVPPVPEEFGKSGPGGWGALVLTFDNPISSTTSFVFGPACPTPQPGMIDPGSGSKTIQLGPGAYGLGATGTEITAPSNSPYLGQNYGHFLVNV